MADESTPLIRVIDVRPHRHRYPHRALRRACSLVLAIVPAIVLVTLFLSFFYPSLLPGSRSDFRAPYSILGTAWPSSEGITYPELQDIFASTPKAEKAREWSRYYTSGPHLAGKNLSQALWTKDQWIQSGVQNTEVVAYDVYLNYPAGHRLALLEKSKATKSGGSTGSGWSIKYEASLEEDVLDDDDTSGLENRVPTFHGYSASGNVTAPYVFVNYGTYHDFEDLIRANVTLEGKIALVKYGGVFRGLKVKRAQELGMIGAIIYSDPGDDGDVSKSHGLKTYPDGPAREPSSVQRGSTQFLSIAPGDPTTPGYPSKPGVPRQPVDGAIPSIPSIPISYLDALPLLKALNGHGPKASSFNKHWQRGGLKEEGVEYSIGPTPDSIAVNLVNEQDYITTPIWNVIGIINGTIPDEVVVLGNHRDAWVAGGAGDPNSGSAAFNEVIRGFGKALEQGWKPLRTVVFASWDGEEYGLLGSTEWVEEYVPWLKASTVAYINVDVGSTGPHLHTSAAPLLNKVLVESLNMVQSPNQTIANQTVGDVWDKRIETMGSGSDFTAFQDFAGIPSIDMGFAADPASSIYHYHSNFDSFSWMERYGDPGFRYHETIAKVWGLLALKIIETPVIPLNATDYAKGLDKYLDTVKRKADGKEGFYSEQLDQHKFFHGIDRAIKHLLDAATRLDAESAALADDISKHPIPWWQWWRKIKLFAKVRKVNNKYKFLERQFLHEQGLDGRNWFKHVVFAPGIWTGYAGATFPGLVESIDSKDCGNAIRWAGIITGLIHKAAASLEN